MSYIEDDIEHLKDEVMLLKNILIKFFKTYRTDHDAECMYQKDIKPNLGNIAFEKRHNLESWCGCKRKQHCKSCRYRSTIESLGEKYYCDCGFREFKELEITL